MSNFKGTKGKWEFRPFAKQGKYVAFELDFDFGIDQKSTLTLWCDEIIPNEEEMSNALLISKAPEMLEMLEECLDNFRDLSDTGMGKEMIVKINQLIKEATEL